MQSLPNPIDHQSNGVNEHAEVVTQNALKDTEQNIIAHISLEREKMMSKMVDLLHARKQPSNLNVVSPPVS